jgi:hypothetical protein
LENLALRSSWPSGNLIRNVLKFKQKSGFDQKKVRNMLNRTYKQGKITRVAKVIYVGVK